MATKLTEQQKTAILDQSAWMSVEEKQVFADKIRTAQGSTTPVAPTTQVDTAPVKANVVSDIPTAPVVETTPTDSWTQDNVITNKLVDEWQLPESQRENIPQKQTNITIEPIPKTTPTATIEAEPVDLWAINTVEDWKKQTWGWMTNLEDWVESKYWTVASQQDWKLTANIWWVNYEWVIDEAWNPIKTKLWGENAWDIFAQLMAWQEIADTGVKTTKEYSTAKARYDIANKYIGMSEDQLYNAYVNGEIGAKLEQDLAWNPALAIAKAKFDKKLTTDSINNESYTMLDAYNRWNGIDTPQEEEPSYLQTLSDKIMSSFDTQWKDVVSFKDYMANNFPDLVTDTKDLNQKSTDLKVLTDERDDRLDEIIKENPWISINRATMLAARQNKDINEQIKSMSYEIGNLQSNINYQTTMADKEFWYEQKNQAAQALLEAEQRWMAFSLLWTAQAQEFQTQQIADQRTYEQANKDVSTSIITDQATGQQQLINSQTWEVIKTYDTGLKAGTATWAKAPETKNIGTSDSPNWIQYDSATGQWKPISVEQAEASIPSQTGAISTWNNNITQQYGATSQVTADNVPLANWTTWTPWVDVDWAIWDPINSFSNGTVVWLHEVNESGWFGRRLVIKDDDWRLHVYNHLQGSNVNVWDTVKRWDTIAAMWNTWTVISWEWWDWSHLDYRVSDNGSFALNGWNWIDPNQFMWDVTPEATTDFKNNSIPQYSNYLKTWKLWTNKDELAFIVKEFWSVENFKTQAENYNNSENWPRWKELEKINILKTKIEWILSDENSEALHNSVWTSQFTIWLTPQRRKKEAYLAEIQNFLDWKTLQQLIDVKADWATFGALSNEELKMLQNSASTLNQLALRENEDDPNQITWFKGSTANFKAKVQATIDRYEEIIAKKEALIWDTQTDTGNTATGQSWTTYNW